MAATRPAYLLLDAIAGWQAVLAGVAESGSDRALSLEPLPGTALPLLDQDEPPDGPACPSAVASEGCGRLLVADAAKHAIDRLDQRRVSSQKITAIGGLGSSPRRFREPRGLALTRGGSLVVADTGNHRVQVFSRDPYALLHVWGSTDDHGRPVPGDGPAQFRWPWAAAASSSGAVYIVDRGNHRVQVFGGDGAWRGAFGSDVLKDPTRIALGPDGTVVVIDGAAVNGRTSSLYLFPCGGTLPPLGLLWLVNPRSAAFGGQRLYVGDAIGLIHVFDPDPTVTGGYRKIGEGVTGLAGAIVELAWDPGPWPGDCRPKLIAIVREEDETGVRVSLRKIDPEAGFIHTGTLATRRLDSGVDQCHWHRVEFKAAVPAGTKLGVRAIVSDDETFNPASAPPDTWNSWWLTGDNPELLLPSGDAGMGRYLWLLVTFQSEGFQTPALTWIKLHYPRESYLQYLPAVYQEDDESRLFLERFLSIFQTEFDGFDRLIDTLWLRLLDPASADARFLPWLAGWLALVADPTWSEATLRSMIKGAFASYRLRGTVAGLEQAVRAYGGVSWGKVLEHYRLRHWPMLAVAAPLDGGARLWSRDFYGRLQVGLYSQVAKVRLTNTPEPAVEASTGARTVSRSSFRPTPAA